MSNQPLSRRTFLRSLGAASVAAFACPRLFAGAEPGTGKAADKVRLALVGCGGQGCGDLGGFLSGGRVEVTALCDPDPRHLDQGRALVAKHGGPVPKGYEDYRRLLDDAAIIDAVLIATPDHWHAPLCRAFMRAGRHIYCEKPLTHTIAEARELRTLSRASKVATQMGNQGSASPSLRRAIEVIKAGTIGRVRTVHQWGIHSFAKEGSAKDEEPVPAGLNWDLWVGPSAMRPFNKTYHPKNWRGWYDFGNGSLADFCCHALNLPVRSLDLGHPGRLVVNVDAKNPWNQKPDKAAVEYHFPARGELPPVVLHWQGGGKLPAEVTAPLAAIGKEQEGGVMIIGDKGRIYTDQWCFNALLLLDGEPRLKDILRHPSVQDIPMSLPRIKGGHGAEWLDAIQGRGRTFSDFDTGGLLTEIGLAGVVALRAGKDLDWDGERMQATNAPEAARFIASEPRKQWLV